MLAARLAARAYEAGRTCLGRAVASLRRLSLEPEGDDFRDQVVLNVDNPFVHQVVLRQAAWLTEHAEQVRFGRTGLAITAQATTRELGIHGLRQPVSAERFTHGCGCEHHGAVVPTPIRHLPLTVITGMPRSMTETPDGRGAMRNDLRPVTEARWAKLRSVPFRDLSCCGEALRAAVDSATSGRSPGLLLIARGGDVGLDDYRALTPYVKSGSELAAARGWCLGTAIGHSHPQQRVALEVPWTEPTPSVAAHNLLRYQDLIEDRAETIEELNHLYTSLPARTSSGSVAEAEVIVQWRHDCLDAARRLGELEAELPNAILRTLRLAEPADSDRAGAGVAA